MKEKEIVIFIFTKLTFLFLFPFLPSNTRKYVFFLTLLILLSFTSKHTKKTDKEWRYEKYMIRNEKKVCNNNPWIYLWDPLYIKLKIKFIRI